MQPLAYTAHEPVSGAWAVTREGSPVASVAVSEEGGAVVVKTVLASSKRKRGPYRFDTFEAADSFVRDLLTSFTYLGCDVATAA